MQVEASKYKGVLRMEASGGGDLGVGGKRAEFEKLRICRRDRASENLRIRRAGECFAPSNLGKLWCIEEQELRSPVWLELDIWMGCDWLGPGVKMSAFSQ